MKWNCHQYEELREYRQKVMLHYYIFIVLLCLNEIGSQLLTSKLII